MHGRRFTSRRLELKDHSMKNNRDVKPNQPNQNRNLARVTIMKITQATIVEISLKERLDILFTPIIEPLEEQKSTFLLTRRVPFRADPLLNKRHCINRGYKEK